MDYKNYYTFIEAKHNKDKKTIKSFYKKYPRDIRIACEYSNCLIQEKNYDEAEHILLKLLKTNMDNSYIYYLLGDIAKSKNNLQIALYYYKKVTNPKSIHYAKFEIGKIYLIQENYHLAKNTFKSLMYEKNEYHAILQLAKICFSLAEFDEAKTYLLYLIKKYPQQKASCLLLIAKIEYMLGNNLESKKILYSLGCSNIANVAKIELSRQYVKDCNYQDAISVFNRIDDIELKKNNIEKYYYYLLKMVSVSPQNIRYDIKDYFKSQLNNYDEYLLFDTLNPKLQNLYSTFKLYLTPEYKFNEISFYDCYLVTLNSENYKIYTLPNTKNIIYIKQINTIKVLHKI